MSVTTRLQKLAAAVGLAIASPTVLASGFMIPELNATGIGLSNALVANPEQIGAIPYNPAAMGFHKGHNLSGGAMLLFPDMQVTTATGAHESGGDDPVFIPHFQGMFSVNDELRLGLGVQAPFGLESKWEVGTFPGLSAPIGPLPNGSFLPPGMFHPTHSKLELVDIVPTVAYRVSDSLSLSVGADYYSARKVLFNTGVVTIRGEGEAWGWNAGALFSSGPLSVGISYHSAVDIGLDGSFTITGLPSIPADAEMNLPSRLQAGVRYAFTDALAVEFDWNRTGWSAFDELVVTAQGSGATLTSSANHWKDTNAYRLGLSYNLTPKTQLRLGYTYDEPGQVKEYFSPRMPDENRHLFSIGLGHSFGDGWQVEGGYMYVTWEDNDYRSNTPFNPLSGDANGTNAVNGDYEANVHIFGLSVNKTFL
jgi:long-chain fatty acid transport protein